MRNEIDTTSTDDEVIRSGLRLLIAREFDAAKKAILQREDAREMEYRLACAARVVSVLKGI